MTRSRLLSRLAPLSLAAGLSACAVGPNYVPPAPSALAVPDRYSGATNPAQPSEAELAQWWQSFGDPVLSDLVARALAANPNVDVAGARLRQARAALLTAQAGQLPTLDLNGSGSRSETLRSGGAIIDPTTGAVFNRNQGGQTSFRAGGTAAYEVDLFGGISRSVEAARANVGGAVASLHAAQLSVASDTALNYIAARNAQARLAIARSNLTYQEETVEIVGWRVQAGLVSSLDLEQARALRAQTAASIPALETNYTNAVNRIAILVGQAPGAVTALIDPVKPIPLAPDAIATGLPADLLSRRPDVVSAERSLAAATAQIGVAESDLYPALRLQGTITGNGTSLGGVTDSVIGTLIGSITAPIFQGGRLRAAIENAKGGADAALGTYRQTVLTALEDVENALTADINSRRREAELALAEEAARNATIYARSQYRAGLIDFQQLLESERSLLSSQDTRAAVRAERANAGVQLYRALGGGWQAAPEPATAARGTD